MELVICQSCGNILKTRARTCENCNALVSRFGSTALSSFSPLSRPLSIEINPEPETLERVLVKRRDVGTGATSEQVTNFLSQAMGIVAGKRPPGLVEDGSAYGGNGGNGHNGANGHNGGNGPNGGPDAAYSGGELMRSQTPPEQSDASYQYGHDYAAQVANQSYPIGEQANPASLTDNATANGGAPNLSSTSAESPAYSQPVPADIPAAPQPAYEAATFVAPELTAGVSEQAPLAVADNPAAVQSLDGAPLPDSAIASLTPLIQPNSAASAEQLSSPAPETLKPAPVDDFFASSQPIVPSPLPPPVGSPSPPPAVAPELAGDNFADDEVPKTHMVKGDDDFFSSAPANVRELSAKANIRPNAPAAEPTPKVIVDQTSTVVSDSVGLPIDHSIDHSDDPEFQKKVTPPLGYQKTGPSSKTDFHDAEKDSSADDEDEPPPPPPGRRSFSGKTKPAAKAAASDKLRGQEEDDDEDHQPSRGFMADEVNFLGFRMARGNSIAVSVALFVALILAFKLFAGVAGGILGGISGGLPLGGSASHLSGRWRFAAQMPKAVLRGELIMHQKGDQIFGEGKDRYGYFTFQGSAKGNGDVDFEKTYMQDGKPVPGKSVVKFTGRLDANQTPPFMQGEYSFTFREGMGWRGQVMTVTNIWEADQTQALDDSNNTAAPAKGVDRHPLNLADLGLKMAIGMISLVVLVFFVLRTGFGPDGWRNRVAKEKYIPSQYLSPHRKELNELSQPLKPGGVPLGRRCEWRMYFPWEKKDLALTPQLRLVNPHILMLGSGDKGKSRLMAKMITHDIESADRAVVVIDSDGNLADLIMNWVSAHPQAKELVKRVSVIDPTHLEGSLAYNPLEMPEDGDLQGAASSLVYGFKAIYTEPPGSQTQWNAQTANILRNAAVLLMVNGRTLTDLPTLMQDNDFRDVLLEGVEKKRKERVEYGTLLETWGQYKRLARTDQWITWVEPILNRTTPMLSDPRIRPILTQEKGDIDLRKLIREKRVLIVKIPQGQLDQNANLLGSLIVTGLKQASLSNALKEKANGRPVALYLDEFQNFIEKETFDAITSDTKKFQIGFVGASKSLQDLPEDFRNQLIINVGCMACFSLAKKDGDMLGPQMFRVDGRKKKHETLQNFINPFNTSHNFELISDEEKLNIDRVVGQAERTYFLYRVGTVAGVFHLNSHPFNDIPEKHINQKLIKKMHGLKIADNGKAAVGAS